MVPTFEKSNGIKSAALFAFLKKTAKELEKNSKQLSADGKKEDAQLDENIAYFIRGCLIHEIAAEFESEN